MSNPPTDTPDTLTRYREKRDFSRTPEPAGKTREQGRELSFVVQRHAARRLHYDLRLEWHGVMKSWAVTRGPSMDPADKRLAVEVEDHPLDYASFEGTIPKPSYGGGIVQVWDRGTWSPVNPAAVDADLAKGELKFIVSGERLNGGFLLVRMRPRRSESDTHRNWLLIKERDSAATPGAGDAVLRAETSVLSGRTLDEIGGADDPDAAPEKTRASAKAPPRKSHKATPATKSAITHPDKVIWPATPDTPAVTKADLAAYYALYADLILPQVGGRPLSILRAPDGIDGQLFFQRHAMRGQSSSIGSVTIEGQAKPYLRIDDAAALAALAQIAVVELHPWGARADHPDVPDRLVFDFDPAAGLAFENVIDAALELRQRLKTLGLESFARVTGGKGLHVVVPLSAPKRTASLGWPEAKQFAHLVCAMMERDQPRLYTTKMAKRARAGKIFLDYLRNDRTSTAIAGWSPRGRAGAPIARPVAWSAVKPGLNPSGWRLPELLGRKPPRDPWRDFDAAGGDLRSAIVKATG
jgi:bifunctional non-homologous end joining protein LigD